jgi:hypothetical protein
MKAQSPSTALCTSARSITATLGLRAAIGYCQLRNIGPEVAAYWLLHSTRYAKDAILTKKTPTGGMG